MKYRHRTVRCSHGFAIGMLHLGIRCPECHPRREDVEFVKRPRRAPSFRMVPGTIVVGVEIIKRTGNDRVQVKCACGDVFEPSRSTISKHNVKGTKAKCPRCRVAVAVEKERGAA